MQFCHFIDLLYNILKQIKLYLHMDSIAVQAIQKQTLQDKIKYVIKNIQYIQGPQLVAKGQVRPPDIYFVHITDEAIQIRVLKQANINLDEQNSYQQILSHSILLDAIIFQHMLKLQKKSFQIKETTHFVVGIYDNRRDTSRTSVVIRLINEEIMNQFFQQASTKLKQQKQFMKKSQTNYLGIQENIRKIVDKIIINSFTKRQIYNRICQKIAKNRIFVTAEQNKMMIYALIGNNQDMQNFLRKQRIQAFDIQKKKYQDQIKEENLTKIVFVQPNQQHVIQGYSEKRKLDGVVPRRLYKRQQIQANSLKNMEQQFLQRIPYRSQMQLDELLGAQNSLQRMQIQNKVNPKLPQSFRVQKIKIPVKEYSLISRQMQILKKQQPPTTQILDRNMQIIIEAVKFMYQMMKINTRQKILHQMIQGPLEKVLDCLRDVLAECRPEGRTISEFLDKANKNYLAYRRNPSKFC